MKHLFSERVRLFGAGLIFAGAGLFSLPSATTAQQASVPAQPVGAPVAPAPPSAQRRLHKARALAAAHNLTAAVAELDAIRNSTTDNSVRDVARILLMTIYLEQSDQARTFQMLDEAFADRASRNESANRLYFALAGKVVAGARERMERYREFGFNVNDRDLPADAENDLNRLRATLERVVNQAKEITDDNPTGTDALALLEDASMVRCSLARSEADHMKWQNECVVARKQLTDSETRIAAISSSPNPAQKKVELAKQAEPTNGTWSQPIIDPDLAKDAIASNSAPVRSAPTVVKTAIIRTKNDPSNVVPAGSILEQASRKFAPGYPAAAKAGRVTGIVKVDVVVDEEGNVIEAKSTTGPEALRAAAIDAAKRWKFKPMVVEGQTVRYSGFITFNFTL